MDFESVSAGYPDHSLIFDELTLQFSGPGLVRLHGPNGVGKSTLIELLSGYHRPYKGLVTINKMVCHSPLARDLRRIVRAQPAFFGPMTVRDHLLLAAKARGTDTELTLARAGLFGLAPWEATQVESLSTGNKAKLWYVISTVGNASLYVLDEPFNGVDEAGISLMCSEIRVWAETALVLIVSHQPPAELTFDSTADLSLATDSDAHYVG